MIFVSSSSHVREYLMDQCVILHLVRSRPAYYLSGAGPDGEDIYKNFNLLPNQKYDVDYVLRRFEEFCEPICNFRMARFKFSKVSQHNGESVDVFYNRILKIARQCEFSRHGWSNYWYYYIWYQLYQSPGQITTDSQDYHFAAVSICCKTLWIIETSHSAN